jgi:hypothetical protein
MLGDERRAQGMWIATLGHTNVMFSFAELFTGNVDASADRIAEQHLEKLFMTKNTEWESEREYRFVVRSPAEYEYVDVSGLAIGYVEWNHNDPRLLGRPLKP